MKLTGVFTAYTAPLGGPVMVTTGLGFVTVTVKLQVAWLLLASVAVQLTVVVPTGKVAPDGGMQLVVTPGQLSFAVTV